MTRQMPSLTIDLGFPRFGGANIRTWIGFKHLFSLAEEAVLIWFREKALGPQRLYHDFGLGLDIVQASGQCLAAVEIDDRVAAEVAPQEAGYFVVRLVAERAGKVTNLFRGRIRIELVREVPGGPLTAFADGPARGMETIIVDRIRPNGAAPMSEVKEPDIGVGGNAFRWDWRARYFHCHYSRRVQHSSYVLALEEVVERFLAGRGISVGRMLEEKGLIPVVSRARIDLCADAFMEETIETEFRLTDILRDRAWEAEMSCYVRRAGGRFETARAGILHAYAHVRGPAIGRVAELDQETLAALGRK